MRQSSTPDTAPDVFAARAYVLAQIDEMLAVAEGRVFSAWEASRYDLLIATVQRFDERIAEGQSATLILEVYQRDYLRRLKIKEEAKIERERVEAARKLAERARRAAEIRVIRTESPLYARPQMISEPSCSLAGAAPDVGSGDDI